jgi:AraC-like DNA-binding protein
MTEWRQIGPELTNHEVAWCFRCGKFAAAGAARQFGRFEDAALKQAGWICCPPVESAGEVAARLYRARGQMLQFATSYFRMEGLSMDEIAHRLGMSRFTLYRRIGMLRNTSGAPTGAQRAQRAAESATRGQSHQSATCAASGASTSE